MKTIFPSPSKKERKKKVGLWVISKFGMVQKRNILLYLLWSKYAGVFMWEWRGKWGPWGLLYAMRIRLTGDVIWKDSEFIFLFLCWLFIELLRVKKKKNECLCKPQGYGQLTEETERACRILNGDIQSEWKYSVCSSLPSLPLSWRIHDVFLLLSCRQPF